MAHKVGGSRGPGRGGSGGGKSRPGPRQPAGRKQGSAGPAKSAPTGRGKAKPQSGAQPKSGSAGRGRARQQGGPKKTAQAPGGKQGGKTYAKASTGGRTPSKAAAKQRTTESAPRPRLEDRSAELDNKVVGVNPVLELLKSGGRVVDTVYVDPTKGGRLFGDLVKTARELGITVKFAPKDALDKMSIGLRHQGAVAVVSPKPYADPDELVASAFAKKPSPIFIMLDGVEDPQNLGAIIRTADCAGADGVFIPEHRAAHLSAAVARASAGALEHVPVAKVKNLAGFIDTLKEKGVWVVGVEAGARQGYTAFKLDVPVAVVLGGEGTGVRPVVQKSCDAVVSLPMAGHVNSLNVSVAAGIMLYEVLRQRVAGN